jgi:predicted RNA-binding protein with PIN domain
MYELPEQLIEEVKVVYITQQDQQKQVSLCESGAQWVVCALLCGELRVLKSAGNRALAQPWR